MQRLLLALALMLVGCEPTPQPDTQEKREYTIAAFEASWCGPCQKNKPAVQRLHNPPHTVVIHIDIDDHPDMADQYGIKSVPTYVVYRDNREIGRTHSVRRLAEMVAD